MFTVLQVAKIRKLRAMLNPPLLFGPCIQSPLSAVNLPNIAWFYVLLLIHTATALCNIKLLV